MKKKVSKQYFDYYSLNSVLMEKITVLNVNVVLPSSDLSKEI